MRGARCARGRLGERESGRNAGCAVRGAREGDLERERVGEMREKQHNFVFNSNRTACR